MYQKKGVVDDERVQAWDEKHMGALYTDYAQLALQVGNFSANKMNVLITFSTRQPLTG